MNARMIEAPQAAAALLKNEALAKVLALLSTPDGEARIVGGALRNAILGHHVHEVDIATSLPPDTIIARAAAAGLRSIPTGIDHGTVTLLSGGQAFEVTTLREDVETDGRHAVVRFGADFARDAERRDFTVNALSMDRDAKLYDYTEGLADLAAHKIRFIGDAATRIREDYLRIMRFFRFSAEYAEGGLDEAGLSASIKARAGLAGLSKERIRAELLKLLMARRAASVTRTMAESGLLDPLLALASYPGRFERLLAQMPEADVLLRLAALCIALPEDADRLRDQLRLSNEEHKRLSAAARALLQLQGEASPTAEDRLRHLMFCHGRQASQDALRLAQADMPEAAASSPAWEIALGFLRDAPELRLPFSGADLQARGFAEGRALGAALKELQARWVAAGFPDDRAILAKLLDEVTAQK